MVHVALSSDGLEYSPSYWEAEGEFIVSGRELEGVEGFGCTDGLVRCGCY